MLYDHIREAQRRNEQFEAEQFWISLAILFAGAAIVGSLMLVL